MKQSIRKLFLFLALTAAAFITILNTGGDFLHESLHHHGQSQQGAEDCPLTQLALQFFVPQLLVFIIVGVFRYSCIVFNFLVNVSKSKYILPALRAPPAYLIY